jgi:16S rRNA (cytidine1402-2'-O)-methyltransferase
VRTARRYLSSLKVYPSIEALQFHVLDKDSTEAGIRPLLQPALAGQSLGILSESGCPGVADPGALAVRMAHELNIPVVPLVGPSSILLSLMASGLNGQHFAFHGYLPIDAREAARAIQDLEKESRTRNQTQIAIETPYRNKTLFQNLVRNLNDATLLTVATDVTGADERIKTITVRQWKKENPDLPKLPTVFLFLAS